MPRVCTGCPEKIRNTQILSRINMALAFLIRLLDSKSGNRQCYERRGTKVTESSVWTVPTRGQSDRAIWLQYLDGDSLFTKIRDVVPHLCEQFRVEVHVSCFLPGQALKCRFQAQPH
jgi:hypothetical protein